MENRIKMFLVDNGWKHCIDDDDLEFASYYKDNNIGVDVSDNEIVFIDESGDFLHLPLNIYALIGALIHGRYIAIDYNPPVCPERNE